MLLTNKKLRCCCDSRSYCVQYFNAIHCDSNISHRTAQCHLSLLTSRLETPLLCIRSQVAVRFLWCILWLNDTSYSKSVKRDEQFGRPITIQLVLYFQLNRRDVISYQCIIIIIIITRTMFIVLSPWHSCQRHCESLLSSRDEQTALQQIVEQIRPTSSC